MAPGLRILMQIYVAASVYIVVTVILLLSLAHNIDVGCRVGFYVRHRYPYNWICCSVLALLTMLAHVFIMPPQEPTCLYAVLEVLLLMAFFLLLGTWLPSQCPPLLYIGFVWLIVVVLVVTILRAWYLLGDQQQRTLRAVHGVLVGLMCPLILLQSQVIHGKHNNEPPILDAPLCALLLLVDFIACQAYISSAEEIDFGYQVLTVSYFRLYQRVQKFQ
ncbi:uncharacterized protein LOC108608136 [Drosophila busckii]|uniref:uncharacterized protein LOC108608136 n=1 Tax=Drosophila busckii TaxID=30019 RepID=UPI00083F3363|nr:uncharacterized protein LOC108608136 [Drosophila busckii]